MKLKAIIIAISALLALSLSACSSEKPAEKAAAHTETSAPAETTTVVDDAMDTAGEAADAVGEAAGDAADAVGEAAGNAMDAVEETAGDAVDAVESAIGEPDAPVEPVAPVEPAVPAVGH